MSKNPSIIVLLIDDQLIVAEAIRRMMMDQPDIKLYYCSEPSNAISMAMEIHPTVILQDLVMPNVNGLHLLSCFRANPATVNIPLVVLTTEEESKIKADAFALGANDYLVKLPDKIELIARIRYHSAAYIRLLERNEAYEKLQESQKLLNADLAEAAEYVKAVLPMPLDDEIKIDWRYIPSARLGGDAFGYHWINQENFVFYLIDVCGHGVGAALLSITILNVLRSQSLLNTNFLDPSSVLKALNETFPMEKHNNMFFTIWYGVFQKKERKIVYSTGGHPPAILINGQNEMSSRLYELKTDGLAIGAVCQTEYHNAVCSIGKFNKLFIFSDGTYELTKADGTMLELSEFIKILSIPSQKGVNDLDRILDYSQMVNDKKNFSDDFSILEIRF